MEQIKLSKRLSAIADYIEPYRKILDVGTDHCFLPIYLMNQNVIDFAIAGDVNNGPLNEGRRHVEQAGLINDIDLRLGSGLTVLNDTDRIDIVVIAGMGGKLISDLLEEGKQNNKLSQIKRLILQPNVAEHILRHWLVNNHYTIKEEALIEDDGILYEIIVAEEIGEESNYNEDDLMFGPHLRVEKSTLFLKKWTELLNKKQKILNNIPPHHQNYKKISREIEQIKRILKK